MLHLCNITAGVWGRYAGEDTRPFDAYSQQRVPFIGLECCCKLATVANVQQCVQKKSGGISAPAIFLCLSLLANNKHFFGLYRKWFTLCDCIVGCPNNINACRDDVVILQRLQTLTDCIICTIVGCFTANNVALH